ncbi:MAG: MoaD/ThiS family protein [Promethearchaeota archaeon]
MLVEVLYFAEFKDITKKETEKFDLSNNKLKELIDLLIKKYNPIRELLWDINNDSLSKNISIIINNKPFHDQSILSANLNEGDKIAFLLPVSGG